MRGEIPCIHSDMLASWLSRKREQREEAWNSGSVANFWKGCGNSYRWTHLCCERGELLKCGLATCWKLPLADHMGHFDAIQRC